MGLFYAESDEGKTFVSVFYINFKEFSSLQFF